MIFPFFKKEKEIEKIEIPAASLGENESEILKDILAPSAVENNPNYLKLGNFYAKTFFIFSYSRFLEFGWFSPLISFGKLYDISIFFHPVDVSLALKQLRKKSAQLLVQLAENEEKGKTRDPALELAYQNVERLRDALQSAQEKLFRVGVYITIWAPNLAELKLAEEELYRLLESRMIYVKPAIFQQWEGVESTFPLGLDKLEIHNVLDTLPASTIFPFSSADLKPGLFFKGKEEEAILYGVNMNDRSLVIFDRFSLENANMLILAKSGAGKSYFAKLEILRSLMVGVDVLIIDPENEYRLLTQKTGGSFFPISIASDYHINPFDLPREIGETTEELIKSNVLDLITLIKILIPDLKPEEESILDKAIMETYASKNITPELDLTKVKDIEFPLLSDLQEILANMEGGYRLASELSRYTEGAFAGFLNQPTNIDMYSHLVTFSLRDLEEELRPIAMFLVLNFIWKSVRGNPKKRLVLIDEAWTLMRHEDSAAFLSGLVKRGRKYKLGITTITQNIEDFLNSPYGMPIVSNSAILMLMRQSPADSDLLAKTFKLPKGVSVLLPELSQGEGLFITGRRKALIKVVSSYVEHQIASTSAPTFLGNKDKKGE